MEIIFLKFGDCVDEIVDRRIGKFDSFVTSLNEELTTEFSDIISKHKTRFGAVRQLCLLKTLLYIQLWEFIFE